MERGEAAGSWSLGSETAIERAAYNFEREYRAGGAPRIEDHLAGVDENMARGRLLLELVHSELELRLRAGHGARLAEYLERFPDLAGDPASLTPLLTTELRLRTRSHEAPDPAEYEARYGTLGVPVHEAFRRAGATRPVVPGYEVLDELGRGGMGVVYRARQVTLRREVALKVIRRDMLTSDSLGDSYRARFRREAEAVAAVGHPDVVKVYEAGEADGDVYLAMELVDGPTLQRRLDESGVLAPREAASLLERAARAVAAVHARGIVHRDLKPDNILLTSAGDPKVADFGLARPVGVADGHTRQGALIGTPEYMSPEQATRSGGEPTPVTDVYGLGAVLYACLAGRPPFPRGPLLETLERVQSQEPPPLRAVRPDCPRDLETIALKCLAKDPRRRYDSAVSLADDLRRWLDGRPIVARRAGPVERAWKWARRRPSRAAAIVASTLLVGAVAWAASVARVQEIVLDATLDEAKYRADLARKSSRPVDWESAIEALGRAEARIAAAGRPSGPWRMARRLRTRLEACAAIAQELEEARVAGAVASQEGTSDRDRRAEAVRRALVAHGIDPLGPGREAAEARVRDLAIEETVIAAVDDWAAQAEPVVRDRLVAFAARLDDDIDRRALRTLDTASRPAALKALAERPGIIDSPRPYLAFLTSALIGAGQFEAARPLLERARDRYPDDFWFNHDLGKACYYGRDPDLRAAVLHLRAAAALNPRSAGTYTNLGVVLAEAKDWERSAEAHREAIRLDPRLAIAYGGLGYALMNQGQHEGAATALRRATELDPGHPEAFSNLSKVLSDLKDHDGARAAIERALSLRPGDAGFYFNRAYVLKSAGDQGGGVEALKKAIELDPRFGGAYYQLGSTYNLLGDYQAAIPVLREAARLMPEEPMAPNLLGAALFNTGDHVGAVAAFREANRRNAGSGDDPDPMFLCNHGTALCLTGDLEGGIALLREVLHRRPENREVVAFGFSNLAEGLLYYGDPDGAVAAARQAVATAPDDAEAHDLLGRALCAAGDDRAGIAAYGEAVRLKPFFAEAHCNLGLARLVLGEFDAALGALREGDRLGRERGPAWQHPSKRWIEMAGQAADLGDCLAALEGGAGRPVDADECLRLARIFYHMNCFAAAASFYEDSERLDPKLLGDRAADDRFHAASSAAMAACGRGWVGGRAPDAAAASRLRARALEWLRADLAPLMRAVRTGTPGEAAAARQTLRGWKIAPELAGVRTPAVRALLPVGERESWSRFWADVEAAISPESMPRIGPGERPRDVFAH